MTLRPKYSLKLFLLFATAVTVFLGYSHHQRRSLLRIRDELNKYGYNVEMPSRWHDYLWQRTPTISDKFYLENRELLQTDLQYESADSDLIATLEAVGITPSSVNAFEKQEWLKRRAVVEKRILKLGLSETEAKKYLESEFPGPDLLTADTSE